MSVSILPNQLGAGALLAIEVAWGADLSLEAEDWTWTDITTDVRVDPGLNWRLGRTDESSRANPAQLTLVLDNSASAYSIGGHSANWPYVRRGTPVRVRYDLDDGSGWRTVYLGFADGWTPGWDTIKGTIPVVTLSASGTLRRLAQGTPPVVSPLRRGITALTSVVAYWPMEDGVDAETLTPAVGTKPMTYLGEITLAQDSTSFLSSDPLPVIGAGSIDTRIDTYTNTGENQVRVLGGFPASNSWPDMSVIARIYMTGTMSRVDLIYRTAGSGSLHLQGYSVGDTVIFSTGAIDFDVNGESLRLSVELVQNGSDVDYEMGTTNASALEAFYWSGTLIGYTCGIITRVELTPDGNMSGLTLGHLSVENDQTSLWAASGPLNAFLGESITTVGTGRLSRLATENDFSITFYSGSSDVLTPADLMGAQASDDLMTLLQECEDVDGGQLWDGLDSGLAYTTKRRIENATTVLTIDAGANELYPPFDPVDDDQRMVNRSTVGRPRGSDATFEDTDGELGVDTVGLYDDSTSVNVLSDGPLIDFAARRVQKGTVVGYRYPSVSISLASTPALAGQALSLFPGARIDVENLDDVLTGMGWHTVSLIVESLKHQVTASNWIITATCSPYEVWNTTTIPADSGDTDEHSLRLDQVDGESTLTSSVSAAATSFSVTTDSGNPLWTTTSDDYPLDLDVGGVKVTVTACSGATSPQIFSCASFPRALAAGKRVKLWQPPVLGL